MALISNNIARQLVDEELRRQDVIDAFPEVAQNMSQQEIDAARMPLPTPSFTPARPAAPAVTAAPQPEAGPSPILPAIGIMAFKDDLAGIPAELGELLGFGTEEAVSTLAPSVGNDIAGEIVASATASDGGPGALLSTGETVPLPTTGIDTVGGPDTLFGEGTIGSPGSFLSVAGGLMGAKGVYDLIDGETPGHGEGALEGAKAGAMIGNAIPGVGPIIGAIVGATLGLGKSFEGGKHPDQDSRDDIRAGLQGVGMLDEDFNIKLADGSNFNLGLDGRASFTSFDGTKEIRHGYEVDTTNPLSADTVALVDPLAALITSGDEKLKTDFASQFTNAAMSNAEDMGDVLKNVMGFYQQAGIDRKTAMAGLTKLHSDGKLTDDQFNVGMNAIKQAAPVSVGGSGGTPRVSMPQVSVPGGSPTSPEDFMVDTGDAGAAERELMGAAGAIANILGGR